MLVTVVILGTAVAGILAAMAAGITLSSRHREQSTAGTLLVSAAEAVKDQLYGACPPTYDPSQGVTVPSGWSVTIPSGGVKHWNPASAAFQASCPSPDGKLRLVTVRVTSPTGFNATVDVVKRDAS